CEVRRVFVDTKMNWGSIFEVVRKRTTPRYALNRQLATLAAVDIVIGPSQAPPTVIRSASILYLSRYPAESQKVRHVGAARVTRLRLRNTSALVFKARAH
ncbi:hypothetical protein JYU34_017580, partial [Plutella xylostella]